MHQDDNLFVADADNHRVVKLSPSGQVLEHWSGRGVQPGQFESPRGLTVDSAANLYVADTGNHRMQKLSAVAAP